MADLNKILGSTLAIMVKMDPVPEDIRGHILARTGKWVPNEVPYGEIAKWVEDNCPEPVPPAPRTTPPPTAPAARGAPCVEISTTREGTTTGTCRCSYTETWTDNGTARISIERLTHILQVSDTREEAAERLEELAWDCTSEDRDSNDIDYEGYDAHESDDETVDRSSTDAADVLERFLDDHPELDPEREEEVPGPEPERDEPTPPAEYEHADDMDRPCARCGHSYGMHTNGEAGRCIHEGRDCTCQHFVRQAQPTNTVQTESEADNEPLPI